MVRPLKCEIMGCQHPSTAYRDFKSGKLHSLCQLHLQAFEKLHGNVLVQIKYKK